MHKFEIYVPADSKESFKEALFAAGAGKIGNYDSCCFETIGVGQFRPLQGSQPTIGEQAKLEKVEEVKIELVVQSDLVRKVIEAIRKFHPYETPAFQHWKVNE